MSDGTGEGPVRARLTRRGWGATLTLVAVTLAALNTANNLLYALASLVAVALPLSLYVARRVVGRVEAELLVPAEITAGRSTEAAVRVRAREGRGAPGVLLELSGDAGRSAIAAPFVTRGGVARSFPMSPLQRGARAVRLGARSSFPWGLVEAEREVAHGEILVLPSPIHGEPVPEAPAGDQGSSGSRRRGPGSDVLDIRDWRHGDEARTIDWKATARLDRPMVREFERERERRAAIVVDARLPAGPPEAAAAAVETAISRAAGAAEDLARAGWRLKLVRPGSVAECELPDLLRGLARVVPSADAPPPGWWRDAVGAGERTLVFAADAPGVEDRGRARRLARADRLRAKAP